MTLSAQLTHFGIHTTDLDRMVDFYTRVMGFVISDHGTGRSGARVVFMTQSPECHHQFVLFDGKPAGPPLQSGEPDLLPAQFARHAERLPPGA